MVNGIVITDSIFREGETAEALRGIGILADLEGRVVMVTETKQGIPSDEMAAKEEREGNIR